MSSPLRRWRIAAAALALGAGAVAAQQPPPSPSDLLKGNVREGFYEVTNEADLTGVPSVPKENAKSSGKRRHCLRMADIERGIQPGKDCQIKSYRRGTGVAHISMACSDGTATETKWTFSPNGFVSETRITGQEGGKPFVSLFTSQAKYLGPCPQEAAPPPKK